MKIKNLITGAIALGLSAFAPSAQATCDISSSFTSGQTLTAAQLNTLVTEAEACSNNILNGDTLTGTLNLHSGADLNLFSDVGVTAKFGIDGATGNTTINDGGDLLLYSDTATTLKAAVYGDSGRIRGYQDKVGVYNINIKSATTTNANDSVTVECGNESCSASNPGFVVMNSGTVGDLVAFTITANVTQLLTGAHWGIGTTGDITGALIRGLFINDNGTLRTCWAYLGGRHTILTTDTNATQTNINLPEEVLCNSAVASATNTVLEYAFFRSNFDDTGGAAEDLWANQTGVGDAVTGETADGYWQPFNSTSAGFSADPVGGTFRWAQHGRLGCVNYAATAETSDSTSYTDNLPFKALISSSLAISEGADNSATITDGVIRALAGSIALEFRKAGGATWTSSNDKGVVFQQCLEIGPSASFIE